MAQNLHTKYARELAEAFSKPSYLKNYGSKDYDWIGNKTIRVSTITTQPLTNYTRSGTSRYGEPTELEDTYQEMSVSQDKSFSITVDKGYNMEQDMMKNAGKVLNAELREQAVPASDKWAFAQWVKHAGCVKGVTKPDKSTIIGAVLDALESLDDALVPDEGRTVWANSEMCKYIMQSTEYMALDQLGAKAIAKGELGTINGARVVKVPKSYLPDNCYFLITFEDSVLFPKKINEARIHEDPPGISGALLEGRFNYDAFVLGTKAAGVYACVLTGKQQTTPVISDTGDSFTIASADADAIYYTTDGSDPRYSSTRALYGGEVTLEGPYTVKAVAYANGTDFTFTSVVTPKDIA